MSRAGWCLCLYLCLCFPSTFILLPTGHDLSWYKRWAAVGWCLALGQADSLSFPIWKMGAAVSL